jgi:hypothetical protein
VSDPKDTTKYSWLEGASTESKAVAQSVFAAIDAIRIHWGDRQPEVRRAAEELLALVSKVAMSETE